MLLAAVQTIRFARAGDFERHRAWALRLFALAIGSWLYRMGYGFYIGFTDQSGHTADFTGWFDYFMDFWFYLPNLVVAEIVIARHAWFHKSWVRTVGAVVLYSQRTFSYRSFGGRGLRGHSSSFWAGAQDARQVE